jgi:DNA primase
MRFPSSRELRARLPVSEVVGRRESCARPGGKWKAYRLQQGENAIVLRERPEAAWFDFLRQERPTFDFVMITEGLSSRRRLRPPPKPACRRPRCRTRKRHARSKRRSLLTSYWRAVLRGDARGRTGAKARGYLADRSLDPGHAGEVPPRYVPVEASAKEHLAIRASFI